VNTLACELLTFGIIIGGTLMVGTVLMAGVIYWNHGPHRDVPEPRGDA